MALSKPSISRAAAAASCSIAWCSGGKSSAAEACTSWMRVTTVRNEVRRSCANLKFTSGVIDSAGGFRGMERRIVLDGQLPCVPDILAQLEMQSLGGDTQNR